MVIDINDISTKKDYLLVLFLMGSLLSFCGEDWGTNILLMEDNGQVRHYPCHYNESQDGLLTYIGNESLFFY